MKLEFGRSNMHSIEDEKWLYDSHHCLVATPASVVRVCNLDNGRQVTMMISEFNNLTYSFVKLANTCSLRDVPDSVLKNTYVELTALIVGGRLVMTSVCAGRASVPFVIGGIWAPIEKIGVNEHDFVYTLYGPYERVDEIVQVRLIDINHTFLTGFGVTDEYERRLFKALHSLITDPSAGWEKYGIRTIGV